MAEKVDIIDIDLSKLEKETKDATKSVKELKKEVDGLQDTTDTSSKDLNNLAGILDKVSKNTDKATESFNDLGKINLDDKIESSEKLAENLGHVARIGAGLSGVFEIIQGGMNLMGVESEKMEEAMVKIQSLMAITQGLSAVGDSVESFQKLSKAIKESEIWTRLFTKAKKQESATIVANTGVQKANTVATKAGIVATRGLKAALISSGIGAIIVGIGVAIEALINNWDRLMAAFGKKPAITPQENITPVTSNAVPDYLLQESARGAEYLELFEKLDKARDSAIRQLEASGAKDEEIFALRQKYINQKRRKLIADNKKDVDYWQKEINRIQNLIDTESRSIDLMPEGEEKDKRQEEIDNQKSLLDELVNNVKKYYTDPLKKLDEEQDKLNEDKKVQKIKDDRKFKEQKLADEKTFAEHLKKVYFELQEEETKELQVLEDKKNAELAYLKENLTSQEEYNTLSEQILLRYEEAKKGIIKKYDDEELAAAEKQQLDLIAAETARYRAADSNLYGKYVGDITDAEDKGYAYEAGSSRLEYLKEQNTLLEEHKNKLIELKATEEQLAEVDAMIAENVANQNAAEKEMWQGRLDGMNMLLDATITAADSIIGVSDTISGAWTNAFSVMQNGINQLGESLKKGEKGWQTWANVAGSAISTASAIMMALADQNDESSEEGFNKEKKFQTAAAVMNTLAGIVAATTSAMSPMNAWMTLPGQIAMAASTSAMIAALGGVQIAKIQQQQYEGGPDPDQPNLSPNVSPTALSQIASPVNIASLVEGASTEGKVKDTRVYVTETDISSTQDKIRVAEAEATY